MRKQKKKGRAKRGIVTRIRRRIEEEDVNKVPERRLRINEEIWRVLIVSIKRKNEKLVRRTLERMGGEREEENLCIVGDFNANRERREEIRRGGKGRTVEEF